VLGRPALRELGQVSQQLLLRPTAGGAAEHTHETDAECDDRHQHKYCEHKGLLYNLYAWKRPLAHHPRFGRTVSGL